MSSGDTEEFTEFEGEGGPGDNDYSHFDEYDWNRFGEVVPEDGYEEIYGEDLPYISRGPGVSYANRLARFAWTRTSDDIQQQIKLTSEMIQYGISKIGRAIDSAEMAYMKLEVRSKAIEVIDELAVFIHLRNVDLSGNCLTNLHAMAPLKHLQVLNVQMNFISSFEDIPQFVWLQALNINRNKLESLEGIQPNYLTYLNLSNNRLNLVTFFIGEIFPNLLMLELRGNEFESIAGIELPKLRYLYIAQNLLVDLDGLGECPDLEHIHARENIIKSLTNFPNLPKLKYVNLRNNNIRRFTQTANLGNSEAIETLVLMDNPICKSERYRTEILAAVLSLKQLDKTIISEIERVEGRHLRFGRKMNVIPLLEDDFNVTTPPRPSENELLGEVDAE